MRDEQQRALVLLQCALELFLGLDVEVVRRLVTSRLTGFCMILARRTLAASPPESAVIFVVMCSFVRPHEASAARTSKFVMPGYSCQSSSRAVFILPLASSCSK